MKYLSKLLRFLAVGSIAFLVSACYGAPMRKGAYRNKAGKKPEGAGKTPEGTTPASENAAEKESETKRPEPTK